MDKNRLLWFNNVIFSFVYKWLIYKYLNAIKAIYMFNKLIMFVGSVYNRYNKDKRGYKDVCIWFNQCFDKVQRIRIKARCRTKCKKTGYYVYIFYTTFQPILSFW